MTVLGNATHQLVDLLASPTETKFCDIHSYSLVKDVHGAALSFLTLLFCICFTIRVNADSRSSQQLRWLCQSQCVMTLFAALNHVYGRKYNDFMFVGWSTFVGAQSKLNLYEKHGGAWYYEKVMPRDVYQYARGILLLTVFDPRYAGFFFWLFVTLPAQPKQGTATSRMINVFLFFSLAPILYELVQEGKCPYGFPVHALSDACVMFVNMLSLMHYQDVDLQGYSDTTIANNGKKHRQEVNGKND